MKVTYTVITSDGHWGKGSSMKEAAKNANVTSTWVNANVYQSDPYIIKGAVECSLDGTAIWDWTEEFEKIRSDNPELGHPSRTVKLIKIGKGKIKIINDEVHLLQVFNKS